LKGEWDPDSAKLEAIYSYGIAETTPEKWWEGILAMRGFNSKLVPKEHFAKYNAEMKEVQTVELGGAAFHPEAEKQICFIQKPKSYDPKHCVTLINFHGGACVFGTAENRMEVCNKMAVRTNAVVINCNYRKAPEAKFPLPCYDAYAIIK